MANESIKEHAVDLLSSYSLNGKQLEVLNALKQNSTPRQRRINNNWLVKVALVGCFLLLVAVSILNYSKSQFINKIAEEVAYNHIKLKPLDINSDVFSNISASLDKLDFKPIKSNQVILANANLLGARYCSIYGNIAAQIRYQKQNGEFLTLYETEYNVPDFYILPNINKGEKPIEIYAKGLRVRLWVERAIVMASVNE